MTKVLGILDEILADRVRRLESSSPYKFKVDLDDDDMKMICTALSIAAAKFPKGKDRSKISRLQKRIDKAGTLFFVPTIAPVKGALARRKLGGTWR